jgi:hypothetical protein
MTNLSPAAQAVLDAYCTEADRLDREVSHEEMLAAALHAVANQLAYGHATGSGVIDEDDLRFVANELKKMKEKLR